MKILFSTNLPSPYRVDFFNELGKLCDLTVVYERNSATDRNSKWKGESAKTFKEVFLDLKPVGVDQSKGNALKNYIKDNNFDYLFLTNYGSPAVRKAILYCRLRKIPYILEYDGGFYKKDKFPKSIIKKFLLKGAKFHFTTCEEHIKYLKSLKIKSDKIFKYPFTSIFNSDIIKNLPTIEEKEVLKQKLGIKEEKVIISVGQFIYRKGFDVLLNSALSLPKNIGVYIIGGKATEEYNNFKKIHSLENVHFIDFMDKQSLKQWYQVADLFVLPTREDIWGLVINEAMAHGLPIITTNKCIAGLELVKNGENGFIVNVGDSTSLSEKINVILSSIDLQNKMAEKSLQIIKNYTLENMAKKHIEILENSKN